MRIKVGENHVDGAISVYPSPLGERVVLTISPICEMISKTAAQLIKEFADKRRGSRAELHGPENYPF